MGFEKVKIGAYDFYRGHNSRLFYKILVNTTFPIILTVEANFLTASVSKAKIFILLFTSVLFLIINVIFAIWDSKIEQENSNEIIDLKKELGKIDNEKLFYIKKWSQLAKALNCIELILNTKSKRFVEFLHLNGKDITPQSFLSGPLNPFIPIGHNTHSDQFSTISWQIFNYFEQERSRENNQHFFVRLMFPENDLLIIKRWSSHNNEKPRSCEIRNIFKRKSPLTDTTVAGFACDTENIKIIEDVEKEKMKDNSIFKEMYPGQLSTVKSMFCLPIFDRDIEEGSLVAVINVHTDMPGYFEEKKDKEIIEEMEPFVSRIIYENRYLSVYKNITNL